MFYGIDPFSGSSVSLDELRSEIDNHGGQAAHAKYLQRLAADPTDPWLTLAVSLLACLSGYIAEHYAKLDEALHALPTEWKPRIVSTFMLLVTSRTREALKELADVEERWPANPCVAGFAAYVYINLANPIRAGACLDRIPHAQQNEVTLAARAQLLALAARWAESLEHNEQGIHLLNTHCGSGTECEISEIDFRAVRLMLSIQKCGLCLKLGRPEEALLAAEQACAIEPMHPGAIAAWSLALCDLGRAHVAVEFIQACPEALRQHPELAWAYGWAQEITTPPGDDRPKPGGLWHWRTVQRLELLPELVRLDFRISFRQPSGPAPDIESSPQGGFVRIRVGQLAMEARLVLSVIDTLNDAVEARADRRLPIIRALAEISLGLYPLVIAVLVLCQFRNVEVVAAWAPIILSIALVALGFGPRRLDALYPPLLKATDISIFGLVVVFLASIVGGGEVGLGWQWWGLVVTCRLLVALMRARRPARRGTIAGEHSVGALFQRRAKRTVIDPELKQCVISSLASDLEVDLTRCGISESPAKLYLDVWFSRVTIRIRPNWSLSFVDNEVAHLGGTKRAQPVLSALPGMPSDLAVRGIYLFSRLTITF